MIKPFFNILLTIVLVSCPVRCQVGWTDCCCGTAEETQVSESECCCKNKTQSAPAKQPEQPVKKCKCICSGATMPDHVDLDFEFQCQPVFLSNPTEMERPGFLSDDRFHPPDDLPVASTDNSVNIGRLIRCLHSSLTI